MIVDISVLQFVVFCFGITWLAAGLLTLMWTTVETSVWAKPGTVVEYILLFFVIVLLWPFALRLMWRS